MSNQKICIGKTLGDATHEQSKQSGNDSRPQTLHNNHIDKFKIPKKTVLSWLKTLLQIYVVLKGEKKSLKSWADQPLAHESWQFLYFQVHQIYSGNHFQTPMVQLCFNLLLHATSRNLHLEHLAHESPIPTFYLFIGVWPHLPLMIRIKQKPLATKTIWFLSSICDRLRYLNNFLYIK